MAASSCQNPSTTTRTRLTQELSLRIPPSFKHPRIIKSSSLPSFVELCSSLDLSPYGSPRLQCLQQEVQSQMVQTPSTTVNDREDHGYVGVYDDSCCHKNPEDDVLVGKPSTSSMKDEIPSSPQTLGWFKPDESIFFHYLRDELSGLTRDELYEVPWQRSSERPAYAEDHKATKAPQSPPNAALLLDHNGQRRHSVKEQDRRIRHRGAQRCADERCPDVAYNLARKALDEELKAELQRIGAAKKDDNTRGKGVGKDQQLLSVIFVQELNAYVLQSEHEGRLKAEHLCRTQALEIERLKRQLQQIQNNYCTTSNSKDEVACPGRGSPNSINDEIRADKIEHVVSNTAQGRQQPRELCGQQAYRSTSPTKRKRMADLVLDLQPPQLLPSSCYLTHAPPQLPPSPTPSGEGWQAAHSIKTQAM